MLKTAYAALDEKLAENITIIDISQISVIADYFLIASGKNSNQVQALVDNVSEQMEKSGYFCKQTEGYQSASWILLDYQDVIIHVFLNEDREFYNLERIWRDGNFLSIEDIE